MFEGLAAEGLACPAIDNLPDMLPEVTVYWEAFLALTSSRSIGMGVGGIPYSEVSGYLDENDIIRLERREQYRHFIGFIDAIFLQQKNPKSENTTQRG